MVEINDGGGSSGGGSTTNICTVNPSDNVAILNNLISRISDIEKFLSQLVGADVHADNLSELADNIGNILNGTITLPSDGNSPYGTGGSIPVPDGFNGTVVSGNVTTIWTDGVVSFQVDNTGIVTGGGSGLQTALFQSSGGALATGPSVTNLTWTTVESQSFASNSGSTITLSSGLYLLTMGGGGLSRTATSNATIADIRVGTQDDTASTMQYIFSWISGEQTTARPFANSVLVCNIPSSLGSFSITGTGSKTGAVSVTLSSIYLGISRLGS